MTLKQNILRTLIEEEVNFEKIGDYTNRVIDTTLAAKQAEVLKEIDKIIDDKRSKGLPREGISFFEMVLLRRVLVGEDEE